MRVKNLNQYQRIFRRTVLLFAGNIFSLAAYAYDNPAGSTVPPVTTNDAVVSNEGTIASASNDVTAITSSSTAPRVTISNSGIINVPGTTNSTTGISTSSAIGTTSSVRNSGSITAAQGIILNGVGDSFTNTSSGTISVTQSGDGINAYANNQSITNAGTISGSGLGTFGIYIGTNPAATSTGTSVSITNTGTFSAPYFDIFVDGVASVAVLNNSQGAGNASGALTYFGKLPTNYNIIINSTSSYGRLAFTAPSGGTTATSFGISALSAGSAVVKGTPYTSVLSGVTNTQLGISGTSLTATSNGYTYTLSETGVGSNLWDLIVSGFSSGVSVANTQQSLVNTASVLQGTYSLQNAVLANSLSYDCNEFGVNNVCISVGGRNTAVEAANGLNNTSALLIAAYRPHPNYRIGAYADQNLSVNNAGGTVNLGNNTPLIGLFGAWNERLDGVGTEIKVSAAYGQKNTTITRSVVGTSEPGAGSSQLNSQGAQVTAKYGFAVMPAMIVSPYVGMRYTQNNMNGYTEGASSSVTAPLTYAALNTNATTALAGVGVSYKVIPQVTTFASAGVETDTNTSNGTYSATGVSGLTPINFNANPVKTRPTAMLGAYYDVAKNQRLGLTGIYRQEAYQAVSTTTVMATYTIGL